MQNNDEIFERIYNLLTLQGQEFEEGSQRKALLYAAVNGISCVKEFFNRIFSELFFETMSVYGKIQLSDILGIYKGLPTEEQEKLIKERMAKGVECYQRGELEEKIQELSEESGVVINGDCLTFYGEGIYRQDVFRKMCSILDAYCFVSMPFTYSGTGLTFEMWDNLCLTFDEYEGFGCPFAISDKM